MKESLILNRLMFIDNLDGTNDLAWDMRKLDRIEGCAALIAYDNGIDDSTLNILLNSMKEKDDKTKAKLLGAAVMYWNDVLKKKIDLNRYIEKIARYMGK